MPKSSVRRRTVAVFVAAAAVAVSTAVLLPVVSPAPAAHAAVAPGSTVRASVVDGTNAESEYGAYQQELSADGNSVVFTSDSRLDNLAPSPPGTEFGYENVFVRDLVNDRTVMISRGQFYWPPPPVIKYGGDRLLELGGTRASAAQELEPVMREVPPNQDSYHPTISADGRYVAFVTTANNIVLSDGDHNRDILVCDRDPDGDGEFDENKENGDRDYRYFRVTTPTTTDSGYRTDYPRWPKLSDDATRIVWMDHGQFGDRFAERAKTAVLRATPDNDPGPPASREWLDTTSDSALAGDHGSPDVSGDGRYIVMTAEFWVPTPDPYDDETVYTTILRVDAETGGWQRVDLDAAGEPIGTGEEVRLTSPSISRDGSVIAFAAERYFSRECDGTCWDRSGQPNVFVVRIAADGAFADSDIVSRDNAGDLINGIAPGLSGDGRFVSFVTDNLNAHDGVDPVGGESCLFRPDNGNDDSPPPGSSGPGLKALPPQDEAREIRTTCQVVVRDLVVDQERLVAEESRLPGSLASPGTSGECADPMPEDGTCGGNANTTPYNTEKSPSLSSDGSRVAYESDATDLVADEADDNEVRDVFVRTFRPELRADPSPLDFGDVRVDTPVTATVRFDHTGIGPLVVGELEIEGDEFTVLDQTCVNEGVLLQQAGSCLVEVEFLPPAEGDFTGLLRLRLTDEREFTVDLAGSGVVEPEEPEEPEQPGPAAFAAGPDPLDFGSRLIRSNGPNRTVTVTNAGETAMKVSAVTVEPPAARLHYTVVGNTCAGAPVAPGASCAVTVRLVPAKSGNLPAVLSFVDSAQGAPHLVGLVGSTPKPEIEVSPAVTPPGRVVTVTGKGFAPNQQVAVSVPLAIQTNPAKVAPNGTFRASLLILPKAAIGNKTVVATVTAFPEVNAEKPLLVVTPTVGPAEFVVRG